MLKRKYEFHIRLDAEERKKVKENADKLHISMCSFIRRMAVNGKINQYDFEELHNIKMLFHAIGNNVNQIARHCNSYQKVEMKEIKQLQGQFKIMSDAMEKYLKQLVSKSE